MTAWCGFKAMFKVLDLFSGIGGFSLGLERTGEFKTIAFCEIELFPRAILARHWPEVPCYNDVQTLTADRLRADGLVPNVICGGFPCPDISITGKGAGLGGKRSGLWFEMLRIISEVRPAFVIAENVGALRYRGLDTVLRGLSEVGYDAEWHVVPATALSAPHRRERTWIVSYPNGRGRRSQGHVPRQTGDEGTGQSISNGKNWIMAGRPIPKGWSTEPDMGRVVDGPAGKVDRRKRLIALGNAVVPQIPEFIGRAILAAEAGA